MIRVMVVHPDMFETSDVREMSDEYDLTFVSPDIMPNAILTTTLYDHEDAAAVAEWAQALWRRIEEVRL